MKSSNYKSLHYITFSNILLLLSQVQTPSSVCNLHVENGPVNSCSWLSQKKRLLLLHFLMTTVSCRSWHSSVGILLGYGLMIGGFESQQGLGIFLSTTASRSALGPIQPPTQWVLGALSLGEKRPGRETDHSNPSSAEVKNAWSYTSTLPIRLHGVVLS
jgi:hypothetical protein